MLLTLCRIVFILVIQVHVDVMKTTGCVLNSTAPRHFTEEVSLRPINEEYHEHTHRNKTTRQNDSEGTTQSMSSTPDYHDKTTDKASGYNTTDPSQYNLEESTTNEVQSEFDDSGTVKQNGFTTTEQRQTATFMGSVSKSVYTTFKKVVWFGIIPLLSLLGICGNITGMWFLFCGKQRQSFHLFLFALMGVDLLYLIIILLCNSLVILDAYDSQLATILKCHTSPSIHAMQSLTYGVCAHLITTMSLERLMTVMFPMTFQTFCLHRHTIIVILMLFFLNIVLGVPGFLVREPKYVTDPTTNVTTCIAVPTALSKSNFSKVYVILYLSLTRFVPGGITTVSSILIAIFLARRRAHRVATFGNKETKAESYEQFKITLTLMILSISLLLSLIPLATTTLWHKYYPELYGVDGPEYYKYLLFTELGYVLRVFSSANDFFIYVMLSKSSRSALKAMVQSRCCFCKVQISVLGSVSTSNEQI